MFINQDDVSVGIDIAYYIGEKFEAWEGLLGLRKNCSIHPI